PGRDAIPAEHRRSVLKNKNRGLRCQEKRIAFGRTTMGRRRKTSIEHADEPPSRLPPRRYALGLLAQKKDGCTLTMLLARGVKIETIDELVEAELAIKKSELVGRRGIEITRVVITDAGRQALRRGVALWAWSLWQIVPASEWLGLSLEWATI